MHSQRIIVHQKGNALVTIYLHGIRLYTLKFQICDCCRSKMPLTDQLHDKRVHSYHLIQRQMCIIMKLDKSEWNGPHPIIILWIIKESLQKMYSRKAAVAS